MKRVEQLPNSGGTRGDRILFGRVTAAVELIGRSGADAFELAFDDDGPVRWWAGANWRGTRMFSEHFPYPAQAVEDLLGRVINGGACLRCTRTTIVGVEIPGLCCFTLEAGDVDEPASYQYRRTCEREG